MLLSEKGESITGGASTVEGGDTRWAG